MPTNQSRISLMDEAHFWIYYLYVTQGPIGPNTFKLTDHQQKPMPRPVRVELSLDLVSNTNRCIITTEDGDVILSRLVDVKTTV